MDVRSARLPPSLVEHPANPMAMAGAPKQGEFTFVRKPPENWSKLRVFPLWSDSQVIISKKDSCSTSVRHRNRDKLIGNVPSWCQSWRRNSPLCLRLCYALGKFVTKKTVPCCEPDQTLVCLAFEIWPRVLQCSSCFLFVVFFLLLSCFQKSSFVADAMCKLPACWCGESQHKKHCRIMREKTGLKACHRPNGSMVQICATKRQNFYISWRCRYNLYKFLGVVRMRFFVDAFWYCKSNP